MNEEWLLALKSIDLPGLLHLYRSQIEHEVGEDEIEHTEYEIKRRFDKYGRKE